MAFKIVLKTPEGLKGHDVTGNLQKIYRQRVEEREPKGVVDNNKDGVLVVAADANTTGMMSVAAAAAAGSGTKATNNIIKIHKNSDVYVGDNRFSCRFSPFMHELGHIIVVLLLGIVGAAVYLKLKTTDERKASFE